MPKFGRREYAGYGLNTIALIGIGIALSLLVAGQTLAAQAEKGVFGFSLKVDVEGRFFRATVKSIIVSDVNANSPAWKQHIAVGDEIVQIEDQIVAGHEARSLQPLMQKAVGETLHLRLKRPTGQIYSAVLVAVRKEAAEH